MQKFLLGSVLILVIVGGVFGLMAVQNARQKFANSMTTTMQAPGGVVSMPSQPRELTGNAQQCQRKITTGVFHIQIAKRGITDKMVLSDLLAIENELQRVAMGNSRAAAIVAMVQQKRAHLATLRLPSAQKTQLMKQVNGALDNVSWCVANP